MVVIAPVENEPVVGPPIRRASGQIVLTLAAITADMIIKPPDIFCTYLRMRGRRQSFFDGTLCSGGTALGDALNRSCGAVVLKQRRASIYSQS